MSDAVKLLFQKYLDNNCTEAERETLFQYFGIEDNEQILKSLIYQELDREIKEQDLDVADIDGRLQVVYNRLHEYVAPRRSLVHINWSRIAAAAAILVAVCSGIVYLIQQQHAVITAPQVAGNNIKPGKNQAILRLSDGREISLNDAVDGQIATQAGVTITKSADGQLVYQAANGEESDVIAYNTIEAPAGGQWQVVLPDQSRVWLNARSSLKYPTRFRGGERKVELTGEAYFEVSKNRSMPFKVMSKGQMVEVLGTHFNMMSYPDDASEKTTLFEGAVKVSMAGNEKVLKPGEQAQVNARGIQLNPHPDLAEVLAWKNGYFKFNGGLEDIMSKVRRWYDVEVVYLNKPNADDTFEGEISRDKDLKEILKIMEYTGKVHFTIKGRTIEVSN